MGRRGTTLLWSSSVNGCSPSLGAGQANLGKKHTGARLARCGNYGGCNHGPWRVPGTWAWSYVVYGTCRNNLQGYRIKPHGQLVLVSFTHYCASTPSLSTSWSRTTLQGALGPGIPNLQTSFPLRCLQRLSLPYLATRQCHWHDNRYTSGTSTPVLSY